MIALLKERAFEDITVQHILDRADVGRTAFYTHYRNKEDVLASSYERLFAGMEALLDRPSPVGDRLFPVREFLEHLAEATDVVHALRRDGRLDEVWALCTGHAARMIDRRLPPRPGRRVPRPALACMVAGSLVEMMRWWLDHPESATPAQLDHSFHETARGMVRSAP